MWELTRRLAARGFDVHVYTMKWWDGARTIRDGDVWLHAISKHRPLYAGRRRSVLQALTFGVATLRLLWEPFDLMDVDHMPVFPLLGARIVCTLRRRRLIGRWHEVWGAEYWRAYLGPWGTLGYLGELASFKAPDVLVANSEHTARRLTTHVRPDRVRTLPPGVDLDHIDTIPPSEHASDIIFAGRLLANKRVDVLIRAVALLGDRREVRCLVVGEGPERHQLESLASELGIAASVEFVDFLPDHDGLISLMKASRIFALPSEREGFGLVVLEANACGVPVITCAHPLNAAQELIRDGHNGRVVGAGPDELARGLDELLAAPLTVAPETACAGHGWEAAADRLAEVLETERGAPGPRPGHLVENSAYLVLTTIAMGALGFVFWVVAARLFSATDIGLATAVIAGTSLISYASLLGLNDSFVLFLPRSEDRDADVTTGLVLVFITAVVLTVVFLAAAPVWVPGLHFLRRSILSATGFVVLSSFCAVNVMTDSVFVALRAARYNFVVDGLVQGATKVILPVAFVGVGAYGVFASWGLAAVVAAGASLILMVRDFGYRPELRVRLDRVRRMARFSSASYASNVLANAVTLVLPLMVVSRLGAAAGGYYYAAFQVANLLFAVPVSVSTAMFAEGSHAPAELSRLLRRTAAALAAMVVPAAVLLALASPALLTIFGGGYRRHAAGILAVLLLSAPAVALRTWTAIVLRLFGRLSELVWSHVILAVVTCALAWVWTGRGLAWVGAAWLGANLAAGAFSAACLYSRRRE